MCLHFSDFQYNIEKFNHTLSKNVYDKMEKHYSFKI